MKHKLILGAAALTLLLPGIAYSQQEQEKERPQQEEHQKAEPETHQQTERTQQDARKQEEETKKQQQEAGKQVQQQEKQQQQAEKENRQVEKKQTEVQRTETQRTERDVNHEHGRIPDDRFRASFGSAHTFRVERRDDRRFQYGGFWFSYAEPWPTAWAYTDDVYVDFIDGQYYLIDLRHPGLRLLLVVE